MQWDAINGIAEVISSIAVVASLGYVAIQIRQNTLTTKYSTTQNLVEANSVANFMIAGDSEFAEIMHKGSLWPESLSDVERLRFNAWFYSYYNHLDFAYQQYLAGQLESSMWNNMAKDIPLFLANLPGATEWWSKDKVRFSREFVDYVDNRMSEAKKPNSMPTISIPEKA